MAGYESGRRLGPEALTGTMAALIVLQFVLGVATISVVRFPAGHPWHPSGGHPLFVLHGVVGALVGLGALVVLASGAVRADRRLYRGALAGLVGVLAGLGGGILFAGTNAHLGGVLLMFFGSLIALCGYLLPLLEPKRPPVEHP